MYKGIVDIIYTPLDSLELNGMEWPEAKPNNYFDIFVEFLEKNIDLNLINEFKIRWLMSLILENVHFHGSGSCNVFIGENTQGRIIEVYEKNGGFDLKNLPNGTGGWGYNEMKRSKCHVSHSSDGRRTFVLVPIKNKKVKQI